VLARDDWTHFAAIILDCRLRRDRQQLMPCLKPLPPTPP
jgi:hypothetical protein